MVDETNFSLQTWMYVAVPMLAYTSERILTLYDRNYKVDIIKVTTIDNISWFLTSVQQEFQLIFLIWNFSGCHIYRKCVSPIHE